MSTETTDEPVYYAADPLANPRPTNAQRELLDWLEGGDITLDVLVERQAELGSLRTTVRELARRLQDDEALLKLQAEALQALDHQESLVERLTDWLFPHPRLPGGAEHAD